MNKKRKEKKDNCKLHFYSIPLINIFSLGNTAEKNHPDALRFFDVQLSDCYHFPMFTTDNWNFASYKNGRMRATLSLVGKPSQGETLIGYGLTLIDEDNKEYFNHDFDKLEDAIKEINIRYAHWDFAIQEDDSDQGGCSSCQAH